MTTWSNWRFNSLHSIVSCDNTIWWEFECLKLLSPFVIWIWKDWTRNWGRRQGSVVGAVAGSCSYYCCIDWEICPEGGWGDPRQFWEHEKFGPDWGYHGLHGIGCQKDCGQEGENGTKSLPRFILLKYWDESWGIPRFIFHGCGFHGFLDPIK